MHEIEISFKLVVLGIALLSTHFVLIGILNAEIL